MANGFQSLSLYDWRQFDRVDLDLSRPMTILTGANGAGKTTILSLMIQHFGWAAQFVAEAMMDRKGGLRYVSGYRHRVRKKREAEPRPDQQEIGLLAYRDGGVCQILAPPDTGGAVFQPSFTNVREVNGLYVPSHSLLGQYQQVGQIPTTVVAPEQFLESYEAELRNRWAGSAGGQTAAYRLKESLIALATFGYGNKAVQPNQDYIAAFEGFQRVLKRVLPKSLRFRRITVAVPPAEVVIETGTGNFPFDAVSGGIATLIDLSWRIFLRARTQPDLVVAIDEPENHLHPELQRELLPGLLRAFPRATFIAATHNPFIVGSVPDSNVYVLNYVRNKVRSQLLDTVNKAGSSNEILRDVLGLDFTMPLWVEAKLSRVMKRYEDQPATQESLESMRAEMDELGLAHLFPDAATSVFHADDQAE